MPDFETLPPFCHLGPDSRSLLRQGLLTADCAPGTPVLYKGQPVSGAYFVLRGRLRVYSLAANGNEATLYCIAPGETCVFALNSLFNDLRYPAWVQAEQPTTVAVIPGPLYRTLFAREDTIRDLTVRTLATLVFRLMQELEQVHAYKLNQRLANLLLLQASAAGELRLTQQQLADHLGTTREVVARLLGEFTEDGLVATGRGLVRIRDAERLAALVAGR